MLGGLCGVELRGKQISSPRTGRALSDKSISALPPIIPRLVRGIVLDARKNASRRGRSPPANIPNIRLHSDHTTGSVQLGIRQTHFSWDHIARCSPYPLDRLIAKISKEHPRPAGSQRVVRISAHSCYEIRRDPSRGHLRHPIRGGI